LYLIPGEHGLKYALLHETSEALYSNYQIFPPTVTIEYLEIFQSHETYTTQSMNHENMFFSRNWPSF